VIPFFVTLPHSGLKIPPEALWLKNIPPSVLNCDVDLYVDELYKPALEDFKIPFVRFAWHRYAVDANRFSKDVSTVTVQNSTVQQAKSSPSDIHWYRTTKGDLLMSQPISQKLHQTLIQKYWNPFQQKIRNQFKEFKTEGHTSIYLLDLHSMPAQGLDFHKDSGAQRGDIVLGTCKGQSSEHKFIDLVFQTYKQLGFQVVLDWPYIGGAITQTYGQPSLGQHVIQVEINRSLYMDEISKEKSHNFSHLQNKLKEALRLITQNL